MTRAPFRGADLSGVDLVLASHKHSDHLDPGTVPDLLAASPGATLVLPESISGHAGAMGLPAGPNLGVVAGATFEAPGGRGPRRPFGPRGSRHRRPGTPSLSGVRHRGERASVLPQRRHRRV